jgi:predicted ATPase with chaperone activity
VARTIADLDEAPGIHAPHIAEALRFRLGGTAEQPSATPAQAVT